MIVAAQAMPASIPAVVGFGVVALVVVVLYMSAISKGSAEETQATAPAASEQPS